MTHVSIISCNVRGINNNNKRSDIFNYLKHMEHNIYCIQDIHCGEAQENAFKKNWDGEMIIATGTSNSRGVAILLNKNFEYKIMDKRMNMEGNFLAIKILMFDTEVSLVNIYGPNTDNPGFYDEIINILDEFQTVTIIMCGDWNLVQDQQLDTKHYLRENNTRARAKVDTIKQQYDLTDPWRNKYPNKKQFTWFQRNPIKMSRLDFYLVSTDIQALTSKIEIKPGYRSDHSIIKLQLTISEEARGKGFWKFNTSLLNDNLYMPIIKEIIKVNIERYAIPEQDLTSHNVEFIISDQLFFETLKMEIRKVTIRYSSIKKKEKEKQEQNILEQIENLTNSPNITHQILECIHNLKEELQLLREYKMKGIVLRSKVQWLEEGEKPTKFFATIEKRNYVNKLINKLNIEGNIIQNQSKILQETTLFYKKLYKSKTNYVDQLDNINQFLDDRIIKTLTEEQKATCEGNITTDEILAVMRDMKRDKTPGIDGIPIEFYSIFWEDLGHFMVRSIKAAFISGELSITQKRGIITCLPKGDKPREFLKNWRPISLLTSDYKVITSVLAKRMKIVLGEIIGLDQRGFLKDRYMEENTRLVYDLIHYCKENKLDGLLLLIDFEKAFDSVEWSYIVKLLRKYNFGDDFIRWFNIVYSDAQSCVINNGNYSEFFNLARGCRQGDPWSPYIFILAIEPLAQCIKTNQQITGINFGKHEIKIGQYADDTFLVLKNTDVSIRTAITIFENFQKVSGLSINVDKTQAIKLGDINRNLRCPVLNIAYAAHFKLLGITFSTNLDEMDDLNYRNKIIQINKTIKLYQWRNLSMAGRITIVKMHLLPKLIHILSVLPSPKQSTLKELNNIFTQFIWNNKRPKIQLNALVQDYKFGGQKMLHLDSFCKASKLAWVNKIYQCSKTNSWKLAACEILKEKYLETVFEGEIKQLNIKSKTISNIFWKELLDTWLFYRKNIDIHKQTELVPNTVIWNSGYIRNQNLLNRRNEFMGKGILYFKDLFKYDVQTFIDRETLLNEYDINITPFDFMCLMHSIPKHYKNIIRTYLPQNERPQHGLLVADVCLRRKACKFTYNKIIRNLAYEIKAKSKWEDSIALHIDPVEWQTIFKLPYFSTIDAQLRIFQYKIIHRILPTNSLLHKYNIRNNPWCDRCNGITENLEHLFHLCPYILSLWYDLANWLSPVLDLFQYINTANIILGITHRGDGDLSNSIILCIKRYIFINKCHNTLVTLQGAIHFLKHTVTLEINVRNTILRAKYIKKWSSIRIILDGF